MSDEAQVTFDSSAWEDLLKQVDKKWKAVYARREFAELISIIVYGDIISHFDAEMGPKSKWTAWSKAYSEHMSKIGKSGNKLLQDTGRLRNSFTPSNWRAQNDGLMFYNNAKVKGFPYAKAHDEGGKKLPQRKFMWLSQPGMNRIITVTQNWLKEGF